MRNIAIKILVPMALCLLAVGCGDATKEAAMETARSAGKLVVTAVGEAAEGAVDVASEAAKGTADAAGVKAVEAKDKVVKAAKETGESVQNTVSEVFGGK